ncbi:YgjP-like metallopeptidase domain-containing protein [Clostridium colicanis]|uniref:YgjP-like metallopeptidase domain-containing protein n=1 Tax=Clostridium colicanis TaxID=179628 RepID=UPI001A9A5D9B|nr:YgjP-like metallopeptidase domain-containing protein [Clostridium colicanis]
MLRTVLVDKLKEFNSELIKASKYCIDYVVLHELIMTIAINSTSCYIHLMPDWEIRNNILNEEIVKDL